MTPRDSEGRVTYRWSFENVRGAILATTFLPDAGGGVDQTLSACIDDGKYATCRVGLVAGKSGSALQFNPSAAQSYAWFRSASGGASASCQGRVLQFNTDGSFVPGTASLAIAPLDQRFTFAMHIKADRLDADAQYHLFGNQNPIRYSSEGYSTGESNASFHLRLLNGVPTLSIYPESFAETPDIVLSLPANPVQPGRWYHLAVTYQTVMEPGASIPTSYVAMYVDGVQVLKKDRNEGRAANSRQRIVKESCLPYYVGGLSTIGFNWEGVQKAVPAPKGLVFPGVIDNVVFSNQALKPEQIAELAAQ